MARSTMLPSFLLSEWDEPGCTMPPACAVTAYDRADAVEIVRSAYRPDGDLPEPRLIEELSPEEIYARLGRYDFGVPVVRGIWYPHLSDP